MCDIRNSDNVLVDSIGRIRASVNISLEIDMKDRNNRTLHVYINNSQEESFIEHLPERVRIGV